MLFGLASEGLGLDQQAGRVVVTDVGEETAGARAGFQAGDQILSVNGQQIGTVADWMAQRMNFEAGWPASIRVQRGAKTLDLRMVIQGRIWDEWNNTVRASNIIFLAYKFITLAIGLFVVFNRPRDFVSRLGGWVLVVMAAVFEAFQWGLSAATRNLPLFLAVPVMLVYVSAAFRTPLLAAFFCLYPKRLFVNRWLWAGFCAGPIVATVYALYLFGRTVYDPWHLTALTPSWVLVVFGVQSLVYLGAVLVALPVSYWKLETVTDRRRFRVLVFGALAAMVFYLPRVIGTSLINLSPWFYQFFDSPYVYMACTVGMLIFPMSFAYAILKQRLFDLRVIIRRGVQYALARRVLLAIAAVASTRRQKWLSALDRRFFRDKYDAQQLFRKIVEEIRRAESMEEVAPRVVGRVAEALHTQGCGLLMRRSGESVYRVVAAAPPGSLSTDLPATNKLIPLVRMLECPVPITQAGTGWLGQQLPQVDKEFLQKARIELLVPVALKEGSTEALLVLGGKLSEEPYSAEDTALLENVAGALSLLLMRGSGLQPGRAFEECPA